MEIGGVDDSHADASATPRDSPVASATVGSSSSASNFTLLQGREVRHQPMNSSPSMITTRRTVLPDEPTTGVPFFLNGVDAK
jgi:hypothetical protein